MSIINDVDKFWASVNKNYPPAPGALLGNCWRWTGFISRNGYGLFFIQEWKQYVQAHRLMMMLLENRQLHRREFVAHKCSHRWCVNPDHLFLGVAKDISKDIPRKSHAKRTQRWIHLKHV